MTGTGTRPEEVPAPTIAPKPPRRFFGAGFSAFLDRQKDRISALQSLVTILALCIGAFWTYRLFIQQRQSYPRLKVEHKIEHWKISKDQTLLSVDEILTNTGSVMVELRGGIIRVIRVMPLPPAVQKRLAAVQNLSGQSEAELSIYDPKVWDVLVDSTRSWEKDALLLEPGESDLIPNEFIIPASVKVVAVYSYIQNPAGTKHHLGWNGLTYYDLEKSAQASSESKGR
ncbi:MAG TPA: hypothetical protein VEV41_15080 [Terriglobales bacterium]|nr:hypothetical protein [Terriglobales bacterium]